MADNLKKIFISAGEYSGDLLGAELVEALRTSQHSVQFYGVTGPAMAAANVLSVANVSELAVMGISEVLPQLGRLSVLEKRILAAISRIRPDCVITVDFPGFHFRLAEVVHLMGIPVFQYVAPKLWAWGASRAERLRRDFSGVIGILPFERDFFAQHDIRYEYVGCPLVDRVQPFFTARPINATLGSKNVLLLPGSRMAEIDAISPLLLRTALHLQHSFSDVSFSLPVAPNLNLDDVRSRFRGLHRLRVIHGNSLEQMKYADAAIVASGTATLECALMELPMVVVYELNPITYAIMRNRIATQWISLVNLVAGYEVVPEFIQNVDAVAVANYVESLLVNSSIRANQLASLQRIRRGMTGSAATNSVKVIEKWMCEEAH